jgi:hypothetical protein
MQNDLPKVQRTFSEGNVNLKLCTFSEPDESQILLAKLTLFCSGIESVGILLNRALKGKEDFGKLNEQNFRKCYDTLDDDSRRLILQVLFKAKPFLSNLKLEFPFSPDIKTFASDLPDFLPLARNPESASVFKRAIKVVSEIVVEDIQECSNHIDCSIMLLGSMARTPSDIVNYIFMCINVKERAEAILGLKLSSKSPLACVDKFFYRSKGLNDILRCKISGNYNGSLSGVVSETNSLGYLVYNKTFVMSCGGVLFPVNVEIQTDVLIGKTIEPDHVKYELSRLVFDNRCLSIFGCEFKLVKIGSIVNRSGKLICSDLMIVEDIDRVRKQSADKEKAEREKVTLRKLEEGPAVMELEAKETKVWHCCIC